MEIPLEDQGSLPGIPSVKSKAGMRFAFAGKQVRCNDEHYADCVSTEAAQRTVVALNSLDVQEGWAVQLAAKVR